MPSLTLSGRSPPLTDASALLPAPAPVTMPIVEGCVKVVVVGMVPTPICLSSPLPDPVVTVTMLVATVCVEGVVLRGFPKLAFPVNPFPDPVVTVSALVVAVCVDVVWDGVCTLLRLPNTVPAPEVTVSPLVVATSADVHVRIPRGSPPPTCALLCPPDTAYMVTVPPLVVTVRVDVVRGGDPNLLRLPDTIPAPH